MFTITAVKIIIKPDYSSQYDENSQMKHVKVV